MYIGHSVGRLHNSQLNGSLKILDLLKGHVIIYENGLVHNNCLQKINIMFVEILFCFAYNINKKSKMISTFSHISSLEDVDVG